MDAWYDLVGADNTIICLGDVSVDGSVQAHHQRWWREAPGVKWLVVGNHDVDPVNQVRPVAVGRTAGTLFAPGDPPLLLIREFRRSADVDAHVDVPLIGRRSFLVYVPVHVDPSCRDPSGRPCGFVEFGAKATDFG